MKNLFFASVLLLTTCVGCQCDRARLNKVDLKVEVQRFDQDLFALNPDSLETQVPALHQKYGEFFELFCSGIIGIGLPQDSNFVEELKGFLTDEMVREGYEAAQQAFPDTKVLDKKLTDALKRYKLEFPDDKTPDIISYVSGFNQSIMLTQDAIGIGLDKYLGADFPLYHQLGFYKYIVRNMYPGKVLSDVMASWAEGKFPYQVSQDELISKMIWEGKLLYFTKQMLPTEPDTCIFGFSKTQLELCRSNEAYMWLHLIENNLLFSTNAFTITKFTQARPFTQEFSREAPGKAANWLGYRIIEKYAKRTNASLTEIMANNDYRKMLEESGYNPR